MALKNLIVLDSMLRPKLGTLVFDLSLSEDHSIENAITTSPVDAEEDEADHAITRPRMFSMTGLVSAESAGIADSLATIADAFAGSPGRHIVAWRRCVEMAVRHEVVSVYTTLEPYERMMMKSARVIRTVDESIEVVVTMQMVKRSSVIGSFNVADLAKDATLPTSELGTMGSVLLNG